MAWSWEVVEEMSKNFDFTYCLSVRQPWAWAIAEGGKDIENRDWETGFRGRVGLHVSKTNDPAAYVNFQELRERMPDIPAAPEGLPVGAIIGSIEIVDCVTESFSPWFFGPFGFVLQGYRALPEPMPCRGQLKFFKPVFA